jgi:putative membrane protein
MSGRHSISAVVSGMATVTLALTAIGQGDEPAFLEEAIQGNMAEVRLGELASQRAENADVRKFGEMVRQDHSAALQRAMNVAKSLKVEARAEPTTEANRQYDGLAQLSGSQFDAAFVSHMIVAHEAEIAKYSRNASSDNEALATLVADTLPKLRAHLAAAQALQKGAPVRSHDR